VTRAVQVDRAALAYALSVLQSARPVPQCWCGKPSTRGEERGEWIVNGGCEAHGSGPPLRRAEAMAEIGRALGVRP
jgi:hypothetical protein